MTRRSHESPWALLLFALMVLAVPSASFAQLRIDITEGVRDAVPIAVVPFAGQGAGSVTDVADVIANDLRISGRFAPLERRDIIARPGTGEQINFQDWRLLRSDFIVVGRVEPVANGLAVTYELFNVQTGQPLLTERLITDEAGLRNAAHRIADAVFEQLTGIPGAFATRMAFVAVKETATGKRYSLVVSDADGFGPRTVTESSEPLMSPAWSPDGKRLAYVSFEGKASAIYVQELATGARQRISARAGINGAPAWSPDGKRLALTLSENANLDVYTLDLSSQTLSRVTRGEAIDTEPEWAADGKGLYFTSDRAGRAQIYFVDLADGRAQRVTFTNGYNARPRLSPDGKELAMVTLDQGAYRIASMDLKSRNLRVLTGGPQDESPSYAPNSALLIYATRTGNKGSLAMVSADGRFQQRLTAEHGDVREPVWSP